MARMIVRLPPDRFAELQCLLEDMDNMLMTQEEGRQKFEDLVLPFMSRRPTDDDQVEVRELVRPSILVRKPW